jgi:hypothetical protein
MGRFRSDVSDEDFVREADTATAQVNGLLPALPELALEGRRHPIADTLSFADAFDQPRLTQDTQMVRHMRLLLADLHDQRAHALSLIEKRFHNLQAGLIPQCPHDARALPFGEYRFRHVT